MTQEELTKIATALEKRTKSVVAHLQALHDMHSTHHDTMHKAHTAHRDGAHAVIGKCMKALGGEGESQDVAGAGPTAASPVVDASGTGAHSNKAFDAEGFKKELLAANEEMVGNALAAFFKGFLGKEDEAAPIAKAAPGLGDRSLTLASILGPMATESVTKAEDVKNNPGAGAGTADAPLTPAEVLKANSGEDRKSVV